MIFSKKIILWRMVGFWSVLVENLTKYVEEQAPFLAFILFWCTPDGSSTIILCSGFRIYIQYSHTPVVHYLKKYWAKS
jgi:hypothetical protein